MAAEMKHRLGVSYRKVCDFLATYGGLHVAPAAFVRAEQRLADRARPTYDPEGTPHVIAAPPTFTFPAAPPEFVLARSAGAAPRPLAA